MRSLIETITTGKAGQIYQELLDSLTEKKPHLFIKEAYQNYKNTYQDNPSINGKVFEFLICETLAQKGILPFYYQARFAYVSNCDFDIVLYHPRRPVALSAKVSLRERYKQADLEGRALRQVYRQARQHLITLNEAEAATNKPKIETGDILGLDSITIASQPEYDVLLEELANNHYEKGSAIMPIDGARIMAPTQ